MQIELLPFSRMKEVGIVGVPPRDVIRSLNAGNVVIHDLDAMLVPGDLEQSAAYLPRVYCAILRTVMINALNMSELNAVFVDTGRGKCDGALYLASILEKVLGKKVIRTSNDDAVGVGFPVCRAKMGLLEKFIAVTEGVKTADPERKKRVLSTPSAGFWGVPPRDFSILELFPDTTHIYGWTRCMENKTPSDLDLEMYCNPKVPTVFFTQSFCAKAALARMLAASHPQSLYLDVDVSSGSSTKAKIEAFLELSGVWK